MFAAATFAAFVAVTSPAPDHDPDIVRKSFVVIKATPSYAEARALAVAAAERLAIRLDLRELVPDATVGLTFSQDACASEFGEFPCYVPRGRWDDGVYLSVEHSSSYEGFEEGLYVVVLASGSPARSASARHCAARRACTPTSPSRPRPSTSAVFTSGRTPRGARCRRRRGDGRSRHLRRRARPVPRDRATRRRDPGGWWLIEHPVWPGEAEATSTRSQASSANASSATRNRNRASS